MIGKALAARLEGFAGLTALIDTRLYRIKTPQNPTLPYVRFQKITNPREKAMVQSPGLGHARFQLDVYGAKEEDVRAVEYQLRLALEDWSGTAAGMVIQLIEYLDDSDHDEAEVDEFRASVDVLVHYEE